MVHIWPKTQAQRPPLRDEVERERRGRTATPDRAKRHRGGSGQNSVFNFRRADNIRPTASECKVQSSFQCWVLSRTTEGSVLCLRRIPKPETAAFPTDSSDTFPSPNLPSSPKSAPVCG